MTDDQAAAAAAAVRVTRAASLFDRLIATLLAQLLPSDPSGTDTPPAAQVELRERLDAFFPEFRQLYGGLLVKHIGSRCLPGVLAALDSEAVQIYFKALQSMEPELIDGLQTLTRRMAVVASAGQP